MQSLILDAGVVKPLQHTCRTDAEGVVLDRSDLLGDGTVFRRAAAAFDLPCSTLPQAHGALAKTREAIAHVRDILMNDSLGPPLGGTEVGVDVPDLIPSGQRLIITVTGLDAAGASCRVFDASDNRQVALPPVVKDPASSDGACRAAVALAVPGVYRVEVKAGGSSPIVQHAMVLAPTDLAEVEDDEL